jgi:hypothetical protein
MEALENSWCVCRILNLLFMYRATSHAKLLISAVILRVMFSASRKGKRLSQ